MRRGAATAALVLALISACAPRASRDVGLESELARALGGPVDGAGATNGPSAYPPATLAVLFPATPLRGANGLACFDRRLTIAEAAGDRLLQATADGSIQPLPTPPGLRGPQDVAQDAAGTLFVAAAASGDVWRRDLLGRWTTVARDLPGVSAVAIDAAGRLFVGKCGATDELLELDPAGAAAPRTITRMAGCPGAMIAADDGSLVVPLVTAGKVVRVRTDDRSMTVLADGLRSPTAVKHAPDGAIVVLESSTGVIRALDVPGGAARELTRLAPGIDGFTICGESAVTSNFVTGEVVAFKPWPTAPRVLEPPGLVVSHGIAQSGDDLLISDGVSVKRLRGGTTEVLVATTIDDVPPPSGIALAPGGLLWVTVPDLGEVHRIDLQARTSTKMVGGLDWPTSIVSAPMGGVYVADSGAGRVVHVDAEGATRVIASGLAEPLGLALRGSQILTLEPEGGRLLGLREDGPPTLIASGFAGPIGLATDPSGRVFVAEMQTGQLLRLDTDGSRTRIAQGFDFHAVGPRREAVPLLADAAGGVTVALPRNGSVVRVGW